MGRSEKLRGQRGEKSLGSIIMKEVFPNNTALRDPVATFYNDRHQKYRISSYKTRGYYFFIRSSTAGIISNNEILPT